jgi:hypothetical protein
LRFPEAAARSHRPEYRVRLVTEEGETPWWNRRPTHHGREHRLLLPASILLCFRIRFFAAEESGSRRWCSDRSVADAGGSLLDGFIFSWRAIRDFGWIGREVGGSTGAIGQAVDPRLRSRAQAPLPQRRWPIRSFDAEGVHGLDGGGAVCRDDGGDERADGQGDSGQGQGERIP